MGRDLAVSWRIELRLAGTFCVIRDGTELSESELGSRKSRTLLKLLAVERPGLVPVDRIVEVLWADEPPAAADQNVATLVSRLRGVLGSGVILGGQSGYRLADSPDIGVDLDAAAWHCEQAERKLAASPAIALVAAEQATGLLPGTSRWPTSRTRPGWTRPVMSCAGCCAGAWLAQGDPERARAILAPLLAVAERVPWTPTLAATLAVDGHALVRLGQDQRARAQLQRAENLAREHGLPHILEEARSSGQALR